MTQMRRICLFGLSADPPTGKGGHMSIVQYLSNLKSLLDETQLEFDEVRVLPVYRHMFSNKRGKQASYDDRLELCRLAFADIPNVVVSDDERRCFQWKCTESGVATDKDMAKVRVGTADLLEMLMERDEDVSSQCQCQCQYTFALGQDTFMDLTKWKWRRSKDIIEMLQGRLVIFRRKVSPLSSSSEDDTEEANKSTTVYTLEDDPLQQRIDAVGREMKDTCPMLKENIKIANGLSLTAISSSFVRDCQDEEILTKNLHPSVLDYIKKNQMYSFSN